jgi:hypothetical protein
LKYDPLKVREFDAVEELAQDMPVFGVNVYPG